MRLEKNKSPVLLIHGKWWEGTVYKNPNSKFPCEDFIAHVGSILEVVSAASVVTSVLCFVVFHPSKKTSGFTSYLLVKVGWSGPICSDPHVSDRGSVIFARWWWWWEWAGLIVKVSSSVCAGGVWTLCVHLAKVFIFSFSDSPLPVTSRVCFVKFHEPESVGVSQHLTNTVFVDRALIVVPFAEGLCCILLLYVQMTFGGFVRRSRTWHLRLSTPIHVDTCQSRCDRGTCDKHTRCISDGYERRSSCLTHCLSSLVSFFLLNFSLCHLCVCDFYSAQGNCRAGWCLRVTLCPPVEK